MKRFFQYLKGLAGSGLDVLDLAGHKFINPHSYTKFRILEQIRRRTAAQNLVETGTFNGLMADRASKYYKKVLTIELDKDLAKKAVEFLAPRKNVTVMQGDAVELLDECMRRSDMTDVLVFLDAHFSGCGTACGDLPEPAVVELGILARYRDKICAIVVDDVRSFGVEPKFPSKAELLAAAEKDFGAFGYSVRVYLDQLIIERGRGKA